MSSSERNSFVAELVKEFGLASEQIVSQTFDQFLSDSSDSDSDFLEELLLERNIISQQQKDRLSQIVAAFDSIPDSGGSASTKKNDRTVAAASNSMKNGNGQNGATTVPSNNSADSIPQNRFRILRPYAQGGLGSISVAHDTEISRVVALKEIQPKFSDSRESRDRFLFEGQVTGQLEHPGIVPVYSLGSGDDGKPYYAMRLIHGTSMRDEIKDFYEFEFEDRKANLTPWLRKMTGRLNDVCMAIEFAHSRDVLHRDLKPSNIMLGEFGETLVVDWGLAKSVKEQSPTNESSADAPTTNESNGRFTQAGAVIGTTSYMSPEQAAGSHHDVGKLSDVFCLGSTLYAILTGRGPYQDSSQLEDIKKGHFTRPRKTNRLVPRSLEAICLKAMAADPTQRYTSARALAEDLENWNADQQINAWQEPWLDWIGRFLRRYRTAASACIIGLVALTAGLFAYNSAITDKNQTIQQANSDLNESLKVARQSAIDLMIKAETEIEMNDVKRSKIHESIMSMYHKFYNSNSDNPDLSREYAMVLRTSGNTLRFLGKREEPIRRYAKACEVLVELVAGTTPSENPGDYLRLTEVYADHASILNTLDRFEEAETLLLRALKIINELEDLNYGGIPRIRAEGIAAMEYAAVHANRLEWEKYHDSSERAVAAFNKLQDDPARQKTDPVFLITNMNATARAKEKLGRRSEALQRYEETLRFGELQLRDAPHRNIRFVMTVLFQWYTDSLLYGNTSAANLEKAESVVMRWREVAEQNYRAHRDTQIYEFMVIDNLRYKANILAKQNREKEADLEYRAALAKFEPMLDEYFYSAIPICAAKCHRDLAILECTSVQERKQLLEKSIRLLDELLGKSNENKQAGKLRSELLILLTPASGRVNTAEVPD